MKKTNLLSFLPKGHEEGIYLEPFFSNMNLLLAKPAANMEAINTADSSLALLFKIIRDQPKELVHSLWQDKASGGEMEQAVEKWRTMKRWKQLSKKIETFSQRLQNVHIFNKPGIEIIKVFNEPAAVLYVELNHEMTVKEENKMAELLHHFKGKVLLKCSNNYSERYANWKVLRKREGLFRNDIVNIV